VGAVGKKNYNYIYINKKSLRQMRKAAMKV